MGKLDIREAGTQAPSRFGPVAAEPVELTEEEKSKDVFFVQLAEITEAMIAKHGADFAMGTLVLSARFIAEGKPLIKKADS
jgi:hypothetical protein